jgi:hypothetical protein
MGHSECRRVVERVALPPPAGLEAAVGAAGLAVVAGEALHDGVEFGAFLGGQRRRQGGGLGGIDGGVERPLRFEAQAQRFGFEPNITLPEPADRARRRRGRCRSGSAAARSAAG